MPYCDRAQVETWAQMESDDIGALASAGYNYVDTVAYIISVADRAIDSECEVPEEFFIAGGVEIEELHDGTELGYVTNWVENPYAVSNAQPLLRLKYHPVLSVTAVESKSSVGAWATLTADTDYVADPLGIRFLTNIPRYSCGNIRVTYKAGYAVTPSKIRDVSAQLAASIIFRILEQKKSGAGGSTSFGIGGISSSSSSKVEAASVAEACFNDTLKAEISRFKNMVPPRVV
jgi:hypothetical protein